MRTVILFVAASVLLLAGRDAYAERRVALVIGNDAYMHGAALANPVNDATAVGVMLVAAGFEVDARNNLGEKEMKAAFRDFSIKTREADVAVVFYAGHGIEVGGENYLIPTDAALGRDIDAQDEAIPLERIMRLIEPARRLRLVILDACRDNPFSGAMKRSSATRAQSSRGLARVEITNTDTLVAFAAKAGSTAIDSVGAHSPFTDALLTRLPTPGLDIGQAFRFVRDDVLASTDSKQEPFLYGSLGGGVVALVPAEGQPAVSAPVRAGNVWREYETAKKIGTKEVWEIFLASHTTGFYADLARAERDRLLAGVPSAAAPAMALPTTAVTGSQSLPPPAAPSLAAVDPVTPAPAAPAAKPAAPAAATPETKPKSKPAAAPTRKFKPEPEAAPKKTATRKSDDDDDKPRARGGNTTRERPARSSEDRPRRTGGTACAYGRAGVRWGRAYGLDNGNGVIAAVAAHCGS